MSWTCFKPNKSLRDLSLSDSTALNWGSKYNFSKEIVVGQILDYKTHCIWGKLTCDLLLIQTPLKHNLEDKLELFWHSSYFLSSTMRNDKIWIDLPVLRWPDCKALIWMQYFDTATYYYNVFRLPEMNYLAWTV